MNQILMKAISKSLLFAALSLMGLSGVAQEMLVDLHSNPRLGAWEEAERRHFNNLRTAGDTLALPFFDDFSEPFTRLNHPHDLYPSLDLWIGKTVYVNNHMAINPPSQGVVTFDGLDENGLAYGFGFSTPTLSDSLTSKPIDLSSALDTVYLSFFYQAQGMGNAPEEEDLLALEFKDSSDTWYRIWDVAGYILEEYEFNQVLLPILGAEYLHEGFQFRFLNYASRAGNVDHWHLDYIELDDSRSYADTINNDLAFLGQTSYDNDTIGFQQATASILSEYTSMPWTHYKNEVDKQELMGETNFFMIHNNSDTIIRPDYKFNVFNSDGGLIFDDTLSSPPIDPFSVSGNESNTGNQIAASNFAFWTDGFEFPTDVELSEDSAFFIVKHMMFDVEDDYQVNDTSVFVQEFFNYYAYDDGTAELAYGLGNLENPGYVAVKYNIMMEDSLRALQIYLNPVDQDLSNEPVKLFVWSGNDEPDQVIYESPDFINLEYSEGINYFYNYDLENAIAVGAGNLWIGWRQSPATGVKFSVGFDQRKDASEKVFYKLGSTWNQSSLTGAVMIRPIFGNPYDWVSGIAGLNEGALALYPNPTTGLLYLKSTKPGQFRSAEISVYDLSGRSVFSQVGYLGSLNLSKLNGGTYVLHIIDENGISFTERVVVQR
jgi:hypothetical protein